MRDPAITIDDPVVKAAIEETRIVLGLPFRLGMLREGRKYDPDADMRRKAQSELTWQMVLHKGRLPNDVLRYLSGLVADWEYDLEQEVSRPISRKPTKKRGRPRNTIRDQTLVDMIARIKLHGINPTRNREMRDRRCGCDIVSQVLGELGIALPEEAIEEIWRRMGHRARLNNLPAVPGLTPDSIGDVRD
jgi:hypothetical protein